MDAALSIDAMTHEQDRQITEAVDREQSRLRNFIRRRVPDEADAEDILQDVFSELVEAYRLVEPIQQVGAWLFRVARNRIIDRFRKKQPIAFSALRPNEEDGGEEGNMLSLEDLLPSPDAGPEAEYARSLLLDEIADALEELPPEQREVFLAHEVEGRSFKELAAATGVSMNTLLSRKRYAVLHLRERLQEVYDDFSEGG